MFTKICFIMFIIAAAYPLLLPHIGAQADMPQLKIGVIDLSRISDDYQKFKDEVERIRKSVEIIRADLEQLKGAITFKQRMLQGERDPDKAEVVKLEIEEMKVRGIVRGKYEEKKLQKKELELLNSTYKDVIQSVKAFAEKNKYDFVLIRLGPALQSKTYTMAGFETSLKTILYALPRHDITTALLEHMNKQYLNQ